MAVFAVLCFTIGRSPRGERGLKFFDCEDKILLPRSLPSRGAWIEIDKHKGTFTVKDGRSPRGERGLKCIDSHTLSMQCWVAPLAGSVD